MINRKPTFTHDCNQCVYLGSIVKRQPGATSNSPAEIDCYWCPNKHPNLASIIGRYGDAGHEYSSSHPPEAFVSKDEYLRLAERWYLFALLQASFRGLYVRKESA